jgi:integrase
LPEHEADFFYVSGINNTELLDLAFKELSGEVLVAFVLAIGGGLRRGEIDNLMWSRIDLKQGIVTVARTATRELKTAASSGHSKLEPRFADVLRKHAQTAKGAYLLCPHIEPRSTYNFYRCALVFERLCEWLEKNGMEKTLQPIHTLRKEYGSHIAKKHGIFRASAALRHSTIAVTRRCYLSSEPTPTDYFSEESTPDNSTMSVAAEVVRMLKAQGLVAKAG